MFFQRVTTHYSAGLPAFQSILFQSHFLNKKNLCGEQIEVTAFPSALHTGYTSCLLSKWARPEIMDLK